MEETTLPYVTVGWKSNKKWETSIWKSQPSQMIINVWLMEYLWWETNLFSSVVCSRAPWLKPLPPPSSSSSSSSVKTNNQWEYQQGRRVWMKSGVLSAVDIPARRRANRLWQWCSHWFRLWLQSWHKNEAIQGSINEIYNNRLMEGGREVSLSPYSVALIYCSHNIT